jgi:hypothetical protein
MGRRASHRGAALDDGGPRRGDVNLAPPFVCREHYPDSLSWGRGLLLAGNQRQLISRPIHESPCNDH